MAKSFTVISTEREVEGKTGFYPTEELGELEWVVEEVADTFEVEDVTVNVMYFLLFDGGSYDVNGKAIQEVTPISEEYLADILPKLGDLYASGEVELVDEQNIIVGGVKDSNAIIVEYDE